MYMYMHTLKKYPQNFNLQPKTNQNTEPCMTTSI